MKKIILSILIIIVLSAAYIMFKKPLLATLSHKESLYLPNIRFPDIPNAEYILYDIISSSDSVYGKGSDPYYYFRGIKYFYFRDTRYFYFSIYKMPENEDEGINVYKINIQSINTDIRPNDTIIGYVRPHDGWADKTYFILTSTNLPVYIEDRYDWEDFTQDATFNKSNADSTVVWNCCLEQIISADYRNSFVKVSENGTRTLLDLRSFVNTDSTGKIVSHFGDPESLVKYYEDLE